VFFKPRFGVRHSSPASATAASSRRQSAAPSTTRPDPTRPDKDRLASHNRSAIQALACAGPSKTRRDKTQI
jgi:hypothetical protein